MNTQGAGWPSLAKICVERVPPRLQGRVWALLSAAGNAGHVCAGPLLLLLGGGWRRIMRGAGAVALLSGILAWAMTGEDEASRPPRGEEDREVILPWTEFQDVSRQVTVLLLLHIIMACSTLSLSVSVRIIDALGFLFPPSLISPFSPPSLPPSYSLQSKWRAAVAKAVEWIFVVRRILNVEVVALFISDSLIYFVIKGLADWSVLALTETKGKIDMMNDDCCRCVTCRHHLGPLLLLFPHHRLRGKRSCRCVLLL